MSILHTGLPDSWKDDMYFAISGFVENFPMNTPIVAKDVSKGSWSVGKDLAEVAQFFGRSDGIITTSKETFVRIDSRNILKDRLVKTIDEFNFEKIVKIKELVSSIGGVSFIIRDLKAAKRFIEKIYKIKYEYKYTAEIGLYQRHDPSFCYGGDDSPVLLVNIYDLQYSIPIFNVRTADGLGIHLAVYWENFSEITNCSGISAEYFFVVNRYEDNVLVVDSSQVRKALTLNPDELSEFSKYLGLRGERNNEGVIKKWSSLRQKDEPERWRGLNESVTYKEYKMNDIGKSKDTKINVSIGSSASSSYWSTTPVDAEYVYDNSLDAQHPEEALPDNKQIRSFGEDSFPEDARDSCEPEFGLEHKYLRPASVSPSPSISASESPSINHPAPTYETQLHLNPSTSKSKSGRLLERKPVMANQEVKQKFDEINRVSESQKGEEGEASKPLGEDPLSAVGAKRTIKKKIRDRESDPRKNKHTYASTSGTNGEGLGFGFTWE